MLTPKQKRILEYLKKCLKKNGYSPSLEEIGRHFKLAKSTIHKHIKNLKEKGYLEKTNYKARSINISEKKGLVNIPIFGMVAAGQQVEIFEQRGESIAVPKTRIKPNQNYFALKVSGESMIEKNINDGDIVLVRQQSVANNGDKVVALIDNRETTFKTFYKEKECIRLQPANKSMQPIIIKKDRDFSIQGVIIDVIKNTNTQSYNETHGTTIEKYSEVINKQTGYSIYKEEAKKRLKQNPLPDLYPELPNKKFDVIYADPPWDYGGKLQFDKSSKSKEKLNPLRKIFISTAAFKYPTLKTSELMKIPIQEIANDNCLLFMWTTNPHLEQATELGRVWGFQYRTVAFIWDKMSHNPGQYTLSNCELCLVFKRGKIPTPRGARNIQQLIRSPRKEHSEKPIEVIQAIEKMFPSQRRVELFARKKIEGWDAWGLDVIMKS